MRRARALLAFVSAVAAVAPFAAAAQAPPASAPPVPADAPTPHAVTAVVDTAPARGVLSILGGGPQPGATLRSLKASATMLRALAAEGASPDDFFGRLVATAAGTPDPLLSGYAARGAAYRAILDSFDAEGKALFLLEARRVVALLPPEPRVAPRFTIVPFFAVSGFSEVAASSEGDEWTLVADVPRIAGSGLDAAAAAETMQRAMRASAAAAWRALFASRFATAPGWAEKRTDLDALLARTVAEGPPMLLLIPDEFYPLDVVFEEPIARAMKRWSASVEELADPKKKETERADVLARSLAGDFWGRPAGAVGVVIADTLLRKPGREAYLRALAAGPRAVLALWLEATKGTKLPQPSKPARRELERLLSGSAGAGRS